MIWFISLPAVLTESQDEGEQKSNPADCQDFPRHFCKYVWNRNKLPFPRHPLGTARSQVLVLNWVRRKEKKENLSLGDYNHGPAFSHISSLNLHHWYGLKTKAMNLKWYYMMNMMRKCKERHRQFGGRATKLEWSADYAPNTQAHLIYRSCSLHCKRHHGLRVCMAQVQILTLPLTSWVTLAKSFNLSARFPPLKNGGHYKTSLWFIVRIRWVHDYRMFRAVPDIQEVII